MSPTVPASFMQLILPVSVIPIICRVSFMLLIVPVLVMPFVCSSGLCCVACVELSMFCLFH